MSSLVDDLNALLNNSDSRTLTEIRESEPSYDFIVDVATPTDGGTTVSFADGLTTFLPGREVKVGDKVTIWDGSSSPGLGGLRHGWALNGELVEWRSPFERVADRVVWLADHDRNRRMRLEAVSSNLTSAYDSLPLVLKRRIDRLAADSPTFWVNAVEYELFICTEAVKIFSYLTPRMDRWEDGAHAVRAFRNMKSMQQAAQIDPAHSGNTYDGACYLAKQMLDGKEDL